MSKRTKAKRRAAKKVPNVEFTVDHLLSLDEGDNVICGSPFPGLNSEELKWTVRKVSPKGLRHFVITYLGVYVGRVVAKAQGNKVIWREE